MNVFRGCSPISLNIIVKASKASSHLIIYFNNNIFSLTGV